MRRFPQDARWYLWDTGKKAVIYAGSFLLNLLFIAIYPISGAISVVLKRQVARRDMNLHHPGSYRHGPFGILLRTRGGDPPSSAAKALD